MNEIMVLANAGADKLFLEGPTKTTASVVAYTKKILFCEGDSIQCW